MFNQKRCLISGVATVMLLSPTFAMSAESGTVSVSATAGLGYSSNVYHSPSAAYFDWAAVVPATVAPNVQSGMFVPMSVSASYKISEATKFKYDFDGQFYLGSGLTNANIYDNRLRIGKSMAMGDATLYGEMFLGWHTQTYFDKDTGENKLSLTTATDISARYNYQDLGFQGKLKKDISGIDLRVDGKYLSRTYDATVVSELDNSQFHIGASAGFGLSQQVKAKFKYKLSTLDYSKRKARDLNANLTATLRSYTYHDLTGQVVWNADVIKMFFDAGYAVRQDNFVGYNDYTKTSLKIRALYEVNQDILLRGKLLFSNTDYTNAFIFEDPTLAKKTSSTLLASISAKYKTSLLGASSLLAELKYKDVSANDLRYNYSFVEAMLGGTWKF